MDSNISITISEQDVFGPGFKPRRSERKGVDGQADLSAQNKCQFEVRVRNLSASGFMAECDEAVQIGSYVTLEVPGVGPVNAQVRWQIGIQMGGMFIDPISLAQCEWTAIKAD
jgi:hypothetical protein